MYTYYYNQSYIMYVYPKGGGQGAKIVRKRKKMAPLNSTQKERLRLQIVRKRTDSAKIVRKRKDGAKIVRKRKDIHYIYIYIYIYINIAWASSGEMSLVPRLVAASLFLNQRRETNFTTTPQLWRRHAYNIIYIYIYLSLYVYIYIYIYIYIDMAPKG